MTRSTGTSTWLDVSVTDLRAATDFYSGLFGWEFEDLGEAFNHYHMIRSDGALVGGLMDITGMSCPDGQPLTSGWNVYLAVDDVDARVARTGDNGGSVIAGPDTVGDSGRMAVVLDSTGARIGMWQPRAVEGYEFTGGHGSPVWFELMTHQFAAAGAFYGAVFDAHLVPMGEPMGDGPARYVTNGPAESTTWGMCDATEIMPAEATGWRVYFGVDGSEPALGAVRRLGGKVVDGPVDSPFGRIATIADPTGATFQISAMSEAVPEG